MNFHIQVCMQLSLDLHGHHTLSTVDGHCV